MSEFSAELVLEAQGLVREFREGQGSLRVLDELELKLARGECVAIVGASGSGKTTLLQILGGLDRPTAGHVRIAGRELHALDETERGALRNRSIGFI
ncbi:MAG: ATP-binding cassette domain-containing protein, partial [Steroidobacteraceae bacterium]